MLFTLALACRKGDSTFSEGASMLAVPVIPDTLTKYYSGTGTEIDLLNKKAMIGRVLFYDRHLSRNNTVSCGSCHKQQYGFADNVPFSLGYDNRPSGRNAMPLLDVGGFGVLQLEGNGTLFWDGRESDLKYLILRPITNHVEMGIDNADELPGKLSTLNYYNSLFSSAYGDSELTLDRLAECMAIFVQSIKVKNTRLDQYKEGKIMLTALELEGQRLFKDQFKCGACHGRFADGYVGAEFVDIGLDMNYTDMGRYTVTGNKHNQGEYRLPNLDNIMLTAPYMHDGRFKTMEEVLDFYSDDVHNSPNLDSRLKDASGKPVRLHITASQKKALIAYMHAHTDPVLISDPKFANPFISN